MSRILITGGAGFVGSHLADACIKAGHEVHVTVRPGGCDQRLRHLAGTVVLHRVDLRSGENLATCLADARPNLIFHLAASPRRPVRPHLEDATENIREYLDSLVTLLAKASDAQHPPDRIVRTGSVAEYGSAPTPHREETREQPESVYAAGLVAAAHYVGALQSRLAFPVVTARLSLIYGPRQSTEYLIPYLIASCLEGVHATVHRPSDRRDLVFVEDAVDALLLMADAELAGATVINVASGYAPTMRDVARLVLASTSASPDLIEYGHGSGSREASVLRSSPDLAKRMLGWQARTPLDEGLARTVDWYRQHGNPDRAEDDRPSMGSATCHQSGAM